VKQRIEIGAYLYSVLSEEQRQDVSFLHRAAEISKPYLK
jgi:hypothetical protein